MSGEYNIAPRGIGTPSVQGGPPIALADPQWVAIQEYVADGKALPITEQQFRNSLGPGAASNLSDFTQLINAYQSVFNHCQGWDAIFTAILGLAGDVYEYGMHKAPTYYPPILAQAQILIKEPGNTGAQQALAAILDVLEKEAAGYSSRASVVFSQVQEFAKNAGADQVTLVGADGKSGLLKYYNEKYATTSEAVKHLNEQIDAARSVLATAEAEYRRDVIIASTTPTYAWFWPAGTIAGAVVAGVYGHRAVEALREEEKARQEIQTYEAEKTADGNLITVINFAISGVTAIDQALAAALPVIETVEGAWNAIASDLAAIAALIKTNIAEVAPIIMGLGVEEALKSWNDVAIAAENYRQHAFIVGATSEMQRWKLEAHIMPPEPIAAAAA